MSEIQRVAIVTGAAGGIGRAMTRGLLAAGIRVAGVDRDHDLLEALAASAREQGKAAELLTVQTDLTNDSAADEITKATRARFGRIDILVNNAGIGPGAIRADSLAAPSQILGGHAGSVAPLCRGSHDGTVGARERCRARNDAQRLGPDRQCYDQPRHDAERRLSDLRPVQGRTRGTQRDYGERPRRHRSDR